MQAERPHQHTHTPTPQPRVAGRRRNPSPNTHTYGAHPSQEWRGASRAPTLAHTHRNTQARSGGAQPKPEPKQTQPRRAPRPGVAGCKRSAHTSTHTAQHPSQEWRGAAEIRAQTHTPTPRTPARSGGVQAERAHKQTPTPTAQPGVAGRSGNPSPTAHTQPHTAARSGRVPAERPHQNTHTPKPPPGVAGRSPNPNPTRNQTQTQTQANSRKPSVHSPGTEAARAMQVTRPKEIRSPGVRLHPKACTGLGLEAERATPKHLGTPVPRTCMHALGTGYARKSGEPLGFRPKEGTCASTGDHPPGMTSSHAGGDQPSGCCPRPLCWGPPVRSSGM